MDRILITAFTVGVVGAGFVLFARAALVVWLP